MSAVLFIVHVPMSGTGIPSRALTVEDGLSQNMVYCISQDSRGFMWFGTQDGLNRFDGHGFTVYKHDSDDIRTVGDNHFFSIFWSNEREMWLGTSKGVYIYDSSRDIFTRFNETTSEGECITGIVRDIRKDLDGNIWIASSSSIFCWDVNGTLSRAGLSENLRGVSARKIEIDESGGIWVASYGAGVVHIDRHTRGISRYMSQENSHSSADVNSILTYNRDTMLVGTAGHGVLCLDRKTGNLSPFRKEDGWRNLFVRQIMKASDGHIWIGTESGVYIYDRRTGRTSNLCHVYGDPHSLSDNAVHSLFEDRDGGIWIGTYFGGVNYMNRFANFENFYPVPGVNSIGGKSISEFCKDSEGYIWIGTEDAGLYRFEPRTRIFAETGIPAKNIHALMSDSGKLWIGSFSNGLYVMDTGSGKIKSYRAGQGKYPLESDHIYSIYKDTYGKVWIGTVSGLQYYDPASDGFVPVLKETINVQVNDILEDRTGLLWFATMGDGVYSFDRSRDEWRHYASLVREDNDVNEYVSCILEDYAGRLWFGTDGDGVCLYDRRNDSFSMAFSTRNGLLNDVIYSLVCDKTGNVWGSTNKGLFRINTEYMSVTVYTHDNGILCDQFNYKSGFVDDGGTVYFGSIMGFIAFTPEKMMAKPVPSSVLVSSLWVNNQEVSVGDSNMPLLDRSITGMSELRIPHGISTFSLGLTEINYAPACSNDWYYRLEGWDKVWLSSRMPCRITYSNLPYGKYELRVRQDPDDSAMEDEVRMTIVLPPPFYMTGWAIAAYIVLAAFLAFLPVLFLVRRNRELEERRIARLNEEKEKEIYRAKFEFFSNITHEIRTPLSLIRIPIEDMIKRASSDSRDYGNLMIIRDNADRLLTLFNQLLDFRKVKGNSVAPMFVHADVLSIVSNVVSRFAPMATQKGINVEQSVPGHMFADVDAEMFTKMVSNLVNNAIKHARTYAGVSLACTQDTFTLRVSNDGDAIPPEYRDRIFAPFFKIDGSTDGFGLGLPLVNSLAELHGGNVRIVPDAAELTVFEITMPLVQTDTVTMLSNHGQSGRQCRETDELDEKNIRSQKKAVLVVDDDSAFLDFMAGQLGTRYRVLKADNGRQALDALLLHSVDAVVCDSVMPVMDGVEFCRLVKSDSRLRHIPVLMLTSSTSTQERLSAISAGADEFIEKPFCLDFLVSCIENKLRTSAIAAAGKSAEDENPCSLVLTKADEGFIDALTELIYSHIEEVDLDVNKLASLMNMSRATLYRRIREVMNVTPSDFIRVIRLKKAAELLRQKEYRINEIAYIVGFSSSSYFSKCFFRHYGVLPKDFT